MNIKYRSESPNNIVLLKSSMKVVAWLYNIGENEYFTQVSV